MIALITDFGLDDLYVGLMKASIASRAPMVPIIDITHAIPAHDIAAGSFALSCAYDFLPPAAIVVAVVDPGVGSERRRIAAKIGGRIVVCPDNGLLGDVLRTRDLAEAVELDRPELFAPTPSATFDGRDVFGPVAAALSQGAELSAVGSPISDARKSLLGGAAIPAPSGDTDHAWGHVRLIDRFGTLATDIPAALLPARAGRFAISLSESEPRIAPFVRSYSDVPLGDLCVLIGSSGFVELARRNGRACECFEDLRIPARLTLATM